MATPPEAIEPAKQQLTALTSSLLQRLSPSTDLRDTLLVGHYMPSQLAALAGGEPLYAYSRATICNNVMQLKAWLPSEIKLHYAIKANPYPAVVQLMQGLVDGYDVASRSELQLAIETGIKPGAVGFAGPGKSDADLLAAIACGCVIHVESVAELARIQQLADGTPVQVALRVNPEFELKHAGMKMAGGAKAFGIDQAQVEQLLATFDWQSLQLIGFHIYCGSQNLNANAILDSQRQVLATVRPWLRHCKGRMYVNMGGGFGVPYFGKDEPLDIERLANGMKALMAEFADITEKAELVLELGRYLVADTGVYLSRVRDVKESHGQIFAVCSGGLHHHLANSGNFGQVVRRNYPVVLANRLKEPVTHTVNVVGPLCTPLDVLADKVPMPKPEVGDWFAVLLSGAYGASASPQNFLGHEHVRELLV